MTQIGDAYRSDQVGATDDDDFCCGTSNRKPRKKSSQTARRPGWGGPLALRRTACVTAIITFESQRSNVPILTPHMPAMIAAATTALIATQAPQRRSALR